MMLIQVISRDQMVSLIIGAIFILGGMISAYVSILCASGKFRPNGMAGVRFNFSRNYRLFNQDKYWYEINRYGGKQMLPISILWALFGLILMALPIDIQIKIDASIVIIFAIIVLFVAAGWRTYRYADKLVSQDKAYIPKA